MFDNIADPVTFRAAHVWLGNAVSASFPTWTWVKGPFAKECYETVNRSPIFDYTKTEIDYLFRSNGFEHVKIERTGSGYTLQAWKRPPSSTAVPNARSGSSAA